MIAVGGAWALATASAWSQAQLPGTDSTAAAAAAAPGGWSLALLGLLCAAGGALWMRQRMAGPLRVARQARQAQLELTEAWVWHSDAEHRLQGWRPPQGAPASAWGDIGQPSPLLWQRFDDAEHGAQAGALRAQLEAHAVVNGLTVSRRDGPGEPLWHLRGLPQFDAQGRFAGYIGSARPLAPRELGQLDAAGLDSLWTALGIVVVTLRPQAKAWVVAAISPQAAQLLPLPRLPAVGCDWALALADWPPALASAVAGLQPGEQASAGGWTAQWLTPTPAPGNAEPGCRLLLLRPQPAATAPAADGLDANDHESFVYSVSHDLRAPIRVVDGFARILKEDYGRFLDRIGNDHLDRVLAAAARMNAMIDALLALSRLQSQPLARKPVDLSQLAGFIVEDLRSAAPERSATVHIEPGISVIGDPTLLRIALENLIGNAWKYSGLCAQTVIEFRREQHDGQPVLVIADQGAGFDMRFADRLFGVFQRLHSPKDFQGTGVGLASVKRILGRHGGDIWAESEVGKGARFYFTIPS